MIEQISKRIGPDYILNGTSMVYFIAQALTAVLIQIFGFIMTDKSKRSTYWVTFTALSFLVFNFLCGVIAQLTYSKPFKAVVAETTSTSNDSGTLKTEAEFPNQISEDSEALN